MPTRNHNLHGSVPDKSPVALLLIDVINDLNFPQGRQLLRHALPMARRLARLKARAQKLRIPAIYVNDNFGRWRSDRDALLTHCLHADSLGHPLAQLLRPDKNDYFVLKPKHSGFYSTTLDTLLTYLHTRTLILTGLAGNICVLFTANDAFMRDYHLLVPADCIASNTPAENRHALTLMKKSLRADISPSTALHLPALLKSTPPR